MTRFILHGRFKSSGIVNLSHAQKVVKMLICKTPIKSYLNVFVLHGLKRYFLGQNTKENIWNPHK